MLEVVCVQSSSYPVSLRKLDCFPTVCQRAGEIRPWKQATGIRVFPKRGGNTNQHVIGQESHFFPRTIQDKFRQNEGFFTT